MNLKKEKHDQVRNFLQAKKQTSYRENMKVTGQLVPKSTRRLVPIFGQLVP